MKLIRKKPEVSGVESFVFEPAQPLLWKAGQFLHYVLHHEPTDDRGSDRWFTVSTAPFERNVQITTRITDEKGSSFKKALDALKVGEEIEISDTDGDFTVEDPDQEYVFIAGGIGITPFRAMVKQMDHEKQPIHVVLLYGNRDHNIPFKEELEELAERNPDFSIAYCLAPEKIDETFIRKSVADLEKPVFYVSGPEPMVDSLNAILKKMGISENRIKGDWFPGYPAE